MVTMKQKNAAVMKFCAKVRLIFVKCKLDFTKISFFKKKKDFKSLLFRKQQVFGWFGMDFRVGCPVSTKGVPRMYLASYGARVIATE